MRQQVKKPNGKWCFRTMVIKQEYQSLSYGCILSLPSPTRYTTHPLAPANETHNVCIANILDLSTRSTNTTLISQSYHTSSFVELRKTYINNTDPLIERQLHLRVCLGAADEFEWWGNSVRIQQYSIRTRRYHCFITHQVIDACKNRVLLIK